MVRLLELTVRIGVIDMRQNDGGPAFPTPESHGDDYEGMSLRDYFAAKVLEGLLAHNCSHFKDEDLEASGVSKRAYILADEMLKARR